MQTFYVLARIRNGAEHFAITVSGKRNPKEAMQAIESDSLIAISVESDHQSLANKARAINAANGIVVQGCSTC